jgi:hypothetical protein
MCATEFTLVALISHNFDICSLLTNVSEVIWNNPENVVGITASKRNTTCESVHNFQQASRRTQAGNFSHRLVNAVTRTETETERGERVTQTENTNIPVNLATRPVRAPEMPPTKILNPVTNACAGLLGSEFSTDSCVNTNLERDREKRG